jgi:hypothetical protein
LPEQQSYTNQLVAFDMEPEELEMNLFFKDG